MKNKQNRIISLFLCMIIFMSLLAACNKEKPIETVQNVSVTGVILNMTEYTFKDLNSSILLTAVVMPQTATNKNIIWKSSNPTIATVDLTGTVKPLRDGQTDITVTTEEGAFTAICKITVALPPPPVVTLTGIALDKLTYEFTALGETLQYIVTYTPADPTNKMLEWVSSDPSVVLIDEFGLATALKEGSATITVTSADGGFTAASEVTVKPKKSSTGTTTPTTLPKIPEPKLDGDGYLSSDNLEDFNKINKDVVSWLYLPGTNINFPVAQTTDNEYYLTKGLNKKQKDSGTAFLDSRSRIKSKGTIVYQNTIIYGHARGTDIFDQLENKTRTNSWFEKKSNRYIYLNTMKVETVWEIYATYYVDSDEHYFLQMEFYLSDAQVAKKLAALKNDAKKIAELNDPAKLYEFMCDEKAFLDFAQNWRNRVDTAYSEKNSDGEKIDYGYLKDRDFGVTISGKDKILTLTTCADATTSMKYIVQARLVKTRNK